MKKNFIYFLAIGFIVFITYVMLLQINNSVFPQADDLCRTHQGISLLGIVRFSVDQYFNWSGRFFTTMFDYFFVNNVWLWKLINPLIMTMMFCLISMISSQKKFFSKKNILQFLLVIALAFSLDLIISKEVFYSITASIIYLFPIVWMLLFITVWMYLLSHEGKIGKKYYFIMPILGIFVGCSHEQVGLIVIWFMMLTLAWKFFKTKTRINRFFFVVFGLVVFSYLLLLLAPGNIQRAKTDPDGTMEYYASSYYGKISLRIHDILSIFHSFQSVILVKLLLFVSITLDVFFRKKRHSKRHILFILLVAMLPYVFLLLLQFGNMLGWWYIFVPLLTFPQLIGSVSIILIFSYILWLINFLALLIYSFILLTDDNDPRLLFFIISILLSQSVMVFSPYSPYRTFFITIIFYWCSLIYVISCLDNRVVKFISNIIIFYLIIVIFQNYWILKINYKENFVINIKNEKLISNYLHNHTNTNLILLRLPNNYFFDMPYIDEGPAKDWAINCFKQFYGMDKTTTIVWK